MARHSELLECNNAGPPSSLPLFALFDHVSLAQKKVELIRAEVGQDFLAPTHGWRLGLARKPFHFLKSGGIRQHVRLAIGDAMLVQVFLGLGAPGTARF